jgi:hypothetical protein
LRLNLKGREKVEKRDFEEPWSMIFWSTSVRSKPRPCGHTMLSG